MSLIKRLFGGESDRSASPKGGAAIAQFDDLCEAIQFGKLDTAKDLLTANPKLVFGKDDYDQTPLHLAVEAMKIGRRESDEKWLGLVEFLLASSSDINAKNQDGNTPLHLAVEAGSEAIPKLLLAHKAKVSPKNKEGFTPLQMAANAGNKTLAELIRANGDPDPSIYLRLAAAEMLEAARKGSLDKAQALIKDHPELVTVKFEQDLTPLHVAAESGHKGVAAVLLANKADANAKSEGGITPLHYAARTESVGHTEVARLLLANKAKVNARDDKGQTPLHFAAISHNEGVAALLAANDADCQIKDSNGKTPVDIAHSRYQSDSAFRRLLSGGKAF